LNDKIDEIDEILAFCSAIDAVDGEMSWNALIDQAHSAHPWSTARMPGWQLLCFGGIVDKQFYQDLLDQISDGVNFVNRDGRITPMEPRRGANHRIRGQRAPVQTQLLTGVIDVAQKSLRTARPRGASYTTWQDFIYAFGRLRSSEPWSHRCLRLQPDVEGVCPRWASPPPDTSSSL